MKYLVIALALLAPSLMFGARQVSRPCRPVHFMTVDDSGIPVPGVHVILDWYFDGGETSFRKMFVSDSDGRFCSDESFPGHGGHIEPLEKAGYVYETYQNMDAFWSSWIKGEYPAARPFKLVFRKQMSEHGIVFTRSIDDDEMKIIRRGDKGEPLPLWVVRRPGDKNPQPPDCFALPEFDGVKKAWKCTFWTTNVNGGVLATTNRVFMAPATGYRKRVEVPMDMCCSPTFTLYVKTHDPLLYAMLWMHGFGTNHPDSNCRQLKSPYCLRPEPFDIETHYPDPGKNYAGIAIDFCRYNVFGERAMERDAYALDALGYLYFAEEALPALAQHQFPPRPDLPARAKNMQRRKALREEWTNIGDKIVIAENDGVERHEKELHALYKRRMECDEEIKRLEEEAPKLILSK